MQIVEANRTWIGTGGLSAASQVTNGTGSRVLVSTNVSTGVRQPKLRVIRRVRVAPTLSLLEPVKLVRSRKRKSERKSPRGRKK